MKKGTAIFPIYLVCLYTRPNNRVGLSWIHILRRFRVQYVQLIVSHLT